MNKLMMKKYNDLEINDDQLYNHLLSIIIWEQSVVWKNLSFEGYISEYLIKSYISLT